MTRKQLPKNKSTKSEVVHISQKQGREAEVPHSNVLDLRSIVAKKEVEQKRAERIRQEAVLKQELGGTVQRSNQKKTSFFTLRREQKALKKLKKKQHRQATQLTAVLEKQHTPETKEYVSSEPVVETELNEGLLETLEQTEKPSASHIAPSADEVAFWTETHAAEETSKKKSTKLKKIKKPKKEKPLRKDKKKLKKEKEGPSFWERPLRDTLVEKAKKSTLPSLGFSFTRVGKPLIGFALLALIFVLPASVSAMLNGSSNLESVVTQTAEDAFNHLQQGGEHIQAMDFEAAESEFMTAVDVFGQAQDEIDQVNAVVLALAKYVPGKGKTFETGRNLLRAGEQLAEAGEQVSKALAVLSTVDVSAVAQDENQGVTSLLVLIHSALDPTLRNVIAANTYVSEITLSTIPEDKQDLVKKAQDSLPIVQREMENALSLTETLLEVLGHEESKRYLVLFQNNHELRPTGGFIGSLALLDISQGVVTSLDVPAGGVYDVAGQLSEQVLSPGPLRLVNPHWNIQDANWFPHFPSSAQKVLSFYEKSGGVTVDGVITLIPRVIEDLLRVSGPIDLTEEFGVIIDADNFYDEVQVRAEEKFDVTTESKRIIGEMTPKLFNQLFSAAKEPESLLNLLTTIQHALNQKDILLYMQDPELQQTFSDRDWAGELKTTDRDYLAVIHANIGGGKTDNAIEEVVTHQAQIESDGSIVDTVTMTRVHKGDTSKEFENQNNVDYVRFYVPIGSTLESASGFQTPESKLFLQPDARYIPDADFVNISGDVITHEQTGIQENTEFEKQVFGGWTQTPVGESSTVTIRYRLPFRIDVDSLWQQSDRYSLLVQKQPGSFGNFFISKIELPDEMEATRWYPPGYNGSTQLVLDQDYFAVLVIERSK